MNTDAATRVESLNGDSLAKSYGSGGATPDSIKGRRYVAARFANRYGNAEAWWALPLHQRLAERDEFRAYAAWETVHLGLQAEPWRNSEGVRHTNLWSQRRAVSPASGAST